MAHPHVITARLYPQVPGSLGPLAALIFLAVYDEPRNLPLPGFSALDTVESPTKRPPNRRPAPNRVARMAHGAAETVERSGDEAYVTLDHVLLQQLSFHELPKIFDQWNEKQSILAKSLERLGRNDALSHRSVWL
eukprot:Skav208622  [mRNA]  locus=scaffold248:644762:646136:- [translate_table: standard]